MALNSSEESRNLLQTLRASVETAIISPALRPKDMPGAVVSWNKMMNEMRWHEVYRRRIKIEIGRCESAQPCADIAPRH